MAKTLSSDIPLGFQAPAFSLKDTDNSIQTFNSECQASGFLMMFICNHCPFVVHTAKTIASVGRRAQQRGIQVFAINANDADHYPLDSFDNMKSYKANWDFDFPYLYDESQDVARAYNAACTPDFFLFDKWQKLHYHGQLDDSRPGNTIPSDGKDLLNAIDAMLNGTELKQQLPSMGCNIKWKSVVTS